MLNLFNPPAKGSVGSVIPGETMERISFKVSEFPAHRGITLVSVKGLIDTLTAVDFQEKFLSILAEKKFKLVVDLKDVNYISSAGWGVFISEIKRIRAQKGDLILSGMTPEVMEIFELLGFDTFLKAFPNVESAVQKGFEKS